MKLFDNDLSVLESMVVGGLLASVANEITAYAWQKEVDTAEEMFETIDSFTTDLLV